MKKRILALLLALTLLVPGGCTVRLFYIGLATPCSTVVQVLLCLLYYAHLARREKAVR